MEILMRSDVRPILITDDPVDDLVGLRLRRAIVVEVVGLEDIAVKLTPDMILVLLLNLLKIPIGNADLVAGVVHFNKVYFSTLLNNVVVLAIQVHSIPQTL